MTGGCWEMLQTHIKSYGGDVMLEGTFVLLPYIKKAALFFLLIVILFALFPLLWASSAASLIAPLVCRKDSFFVGRKGDSWFRAFLQGQVLLGKAQTASYSSKYLGFAAVVK